MSSKFTIRPENQVDFEQVSQIVKKAFTEGDLGYQGEGELVEKLRAFDGYIPELSLVAEADRQIVGHIILSRVFIQTDTVSVPTLILAPVSVLPSFQKQGIGGALINAVHKAAIDMGESNVFLLGHLEYYPRFGYGPSRHFGISFPDGREDDHCMSIELVSGSLEGIHGTLEYSKPFYEI